MPSKSDKLESALESLEREITTTEKATKRVRDVIQQERGKAARGRKTSRKKPISKSSKRGSPRRKKAAARRLPGKPTTHTYDDE